MKEGDFKLDHLDFREYTNLQLAVAGELSRRLQRPAEECIELYSEKFREYVLSHPDLAEQLARDRNAVILNIIAYLLPPPETASNSR